MYVYQSMVNHAYLLYRLLYQTQPNDQTTTKSKIISELITKLFIICNKSTEQIIDKKLTKRLINPITNPPHNQSTNQKFTFSSSWPIARERWTSMPPRLFSEPSMSSLCWLHNACSFAQACMTPSMGCEAN